jgi:5-methylcytosine-specific restriction enzyme subunit McrC
MSPQSAFSIDSLCNMILYAWRLWPSGYSAYSGKTTNLSPLDLLGVLLSQSVIKAAKAGLYRDYREREELAFVPRGRILISETLKRRAVNDRQLYITTDEFTVDCLANQILLWAVSALNRVTSIDKMVNAQLLRSRDILSNVSYVSPSSQEMNFEMSRIRRKEYKLGLSIAIILYQSKIFSPSRQGNLSSEIPLIDDEHLFRRLYETFLREFYKFHFKENTVTGRFYDWGAGPTGRFPRMVTDINVESDQQIILMDAKCTPKVLTRRDEFSNGTLNSGHLYQIFTYMAHASSLNSEKSVKGVLIYPQYDQFVDEQVVTLHGSLRVRTINFKEGWSSIESKLSELI